MSMADKNVNAQHLSLCNFGMQCNKQFLTLYCTRTSMFSKAILILWHANYFANFIASVSRALRLCTGVGTTTM